LVAAPDAVLSFTGAGLPVTGFGTIGAVSGLFLGEGTG
jgi:hypothetical protein